ncbi:hypothetical protein LOTGIDRAFT_142981 [Lottia gigantea]|uniref:Uncharacterized protein n=1 Tax=Lottia gigantea TaxID=225164 RepID=V4ATE4_LOTGI|nr:hypothetical protein LOTGIDRAFT_142981 [Lottia gigantea]ESO98165.1 hypothetical protein LOTGIDRAFT_142981 [Lottia gigantea]
MKGRPCELSAMSFVPKNRNDLPPDQTFYNTPDFLNDKKKKNSTFDRLFKIKDGYNQKVHRDDREHFNSVGLNVHQEESNKIVPTLSSTEYGHRLQHHLEDRDRDHVRVETVKAEFYTRHKTS